MRKQFPQPASDDRAEAFLETADLSEHDFSGFERVTFEFRKNDASVSLRLPESLLEAVRARAKRDGMPYQRFMRLAIERAVSEPRPT